MSGVAAEIVRRVFGRRVGRDVLPRLRFAAGAVIEPLESRRLLASFAVSNTLDAGPGSLRQAILDANAGEGPDVIQFAIGSGSQTIRPASALPDITDTVAIDGRTQSGFMDGPLIELDGSEAGPDASGLTLRAGSNLIRGLFINRFGGDGIAIEGGGDNLIEGNYLGADYIGDLPLWGNGRHGIHISNSLGNSIGGQGAASNVISANSGDGIRLDAGSSSTFIYGNSIGFNANGIAIADASGNFIGAITANAGNLIAFNRLSGISITGPGTAGNHIFGNLIFDNAGLGIDLNDDGLTSNDDADVDSGPNNLQNYPELTVATLTAVQTHIEGFLAATPNTTFTIELFSNPSNALQPFQGQIPLTTLSATTGPGGLASFSTDLDWPLHPSQFLTATATDAAGNTSEFSPGMAFSEIEIRSPLVAIGESLDGFAGFEVSGVIATLVDPDYVSAAEDFTVTILWGDGTPADAGSVVDYGEGVFQVIGSHTYALSGDYEVDVEITHRDSRTAQALGLIGIVDSELQISPMEEVTLSLGDESEVVLADLYDPMAAAPESFTVTIDWGDGSEPSAGRVVGGEGGYLILGSHSYGSTSAYQYVEITLVDNDGRRVDATVTAHVLDGGFVLEGFELSTRAGVLLDSDLARIDASFDPAASNELSATIDWGDGSTSAGFISDLGDYRLLVRGSHQYSAPGEFMGRVTVAREDGRTASVEVMIHVGESAVSPLLVLPEVSGSTAWRPADDHRVATIHDPDERSSAPDFGVTIDWGDGTDPTPGRVEQEESGGFRVLGTHTYTAGGWYSITVLIQHADGRTGEAASRINVDDARIDRYVPEITTVVGVPLVHQLLTTFIDRRPNTKASEYTVLIDWERRGEFEQGLVVATKNGKFRIFGDHVFKRSGWHTPVIRINHADGRQTSDGIEVYVATKNTLRARGVNVVAVEGLTMPAVRAATFTSEGPDAEISPERFTAEIDWGDGQSSVGSVVLQNNGTFAVVGSHAYGRAGRYQVSATIIHPIGVRVTTRSRVQVINAPLISHTQPLVAAANQRRQGAIFSFVDSNPLAVAQDYQAIIRWGDGSQSSAVIRRGRGGQFVIVGAHSYKTAGLFTITLDLLDSANSHTLFRIPVLVR